MVGVAGVVLATAAVLAIVGGLLLALYPIKGFRVPVGDDVPTYVWRSRVVAADGVHGLQTSNQYPFHSSSSNPARPGYPLTATLLDEVTGVTPWRLSFVFPTVAAIAIGLAAAVLAVVCLGEPLWSFPLYALMVGLSANVLITANGYFDNLMVDIVMVGAVATGLLVAEGRRAGAATALLLAGAAIIHWQFAVLLVGLLGLLVLLVLPASLRARREGAHLLATPSFRLAGAVAAGIAGGGTALLLTPGLGSLGTNTRSRYEVYLRRQLPLYALPVTVPIAAGGVAALVQGRDPRRVRGAVVFAVWTGIGALVYLAFLLGANVPAQRLLGVALGLPILSAAAVVWVARRLLRAGGTTRIRRLARVGAIVVLAAAVAGSLVTGLRAWYRNKPYETPGTHASIAATMDYVRTLPPGTPVVFVVATKEQGQHAGGEPAIPGGSGVGQALRRLRAQAPPSRVPDIFIYLGTPEHLLAGEPTVEPGNTAFNADSALFLRLDRDALARNPVIIVPRAFFAHYYRATGSHTQWPKTDEFIVVRGPAPAASATTPEGLPAQGMLGLAAVTLLVLLALSVAGSGWSTLTPAPWGARLALAPAFGVATVALGGLVADRAGLGLSGGGRGLTIVAAVTVLGWVPFAVTRLVARRQHHEPGAPPPDVHAGAITAHERATA